MRRPLAVGGLAALAFYGWVLARHAQEVASGADNSGYMNAARLFLAGKLREELRLPPGVTPEQFRPWVFTPLGFIPTPDGQQLVPLYPPGLSLAQAAAASLVGSVEQASRWVNVVFGVLLLPLMYRTARVVGLSRGYALGATVLLALDPVTLRFFTWNMSDGPATFWVTAAMCFALKSRGRTSYATLAGFAFSVATAIRPTNFLLLPALLFACFRARQGLPAFAIGASPVLLLLFAYNQLQYGAFWRTGYGAVAQEFKARYLLPTLWHYLLWLGRFFSPLALLALAVHLRAAAKRFQPHLVLALWWMPFFAFYAFYKYTNDAWWYLRFVLPALPALILGACAAVPDLTRSLARWWQPKWARAVAWLVAAMAGAASLWWVSRLRVLELTRDELMYRQGVQWVDKHTPERSMIFASQLSGSFYFYTPRAVLRYDLTTPQELMGLLGLAEQKGIPAYLALFDFEARVFTRRNPNLTEPKGSWGRIVLLQFVPKASQEVGKVLASPPVRRPSVIPDGK
ncbi:MAG: glycosyltransferase family 39 protein [Thermoanaerobaculum sp.]|nr:glycosyltransferase family 39 protein [Thermoanaerobaculum sp.]MDW7968363.1 glycosyltransferase family 39 protein [Thermoanaerobaculum sp.]